MLRLKKIIGFSLLGVYIILMMSFVNVAYNENYCSAIDIIIQDSAITRFVQKNDIYQILNEGNYNILAKTPSEIDLYTIENKVKDHSSIKDCDCFFLTDGTLRIEISQRHPIARIITNKYKIYIDEEGGQMPPSNFYTAHVPIITGYVKEELISTDLYAIAQKIHDDEFLKAQIEQINVTSKGEYTLIPRAGRQTIEIGDAENLDIKFKSLKALYIQIFNKNAWNKYKTISLKYDGQVVCTKK